MKPHFFHTTVRRGAFIRRKLFELMGSGRFSHLAAHGMDRAIERHLDLDGGFFIEAGAHDGQAQSNTYYFEIIRGWRGLLIEPNPRLAAICRKRRPKSYVVQAALVGPDYSQETIDLSSGELTAAVVERHPLGPPTPSLPGSMTVPAQTLTRVLDGQGITREIDLFSLDVEGYEPEVLRGLDLNRYAPRFLCIEVHDQPAIQSILGGRYDMVEVLYDAGSYRDVLFRRR